ncbi:MAG TPA: type III pantothenate kinase [Saprospiraceae bacterium]|nr:type III pantothenate kinase [Saprospiraceae bacterium]HMQ85102.1 type III pantothenate kinase [Saprospiraceae bacterium]
MLLAIDIGNSNVVLGIHHEDNWRYVWRLPTTHSPDASFYYLLEIRNLLLEGSLTLDDIDRVVLSSVVPDLSPVFYKIMQELFQFPPIVVGPTIYPLLDLQIANPNELGTDLYANALAALKLYRSNCIVVDFGTALTFTIVNKTGQLLGVSIAPGLKTAVYSLFQKTAQLPEVPLTFPPTALGKDTIHAIQSGVLIGYVGLVKHLLEELRKELGHDYQAIATGGLVSILEPLHSEFHAIEPLLTLHGLRIIGEAL